MQQIFKAANKMKTKQKSVVTCQVNQRFQQQCQDMSMQQQARAEEVIALTSDEESEGERAVLDPTDDNSDISSTISSTLSSHRSPDYEAEADEEDANEGEDIKKQQPHGNESLLHVQNFLNAFTASTSKSQQHAPSMKGLVFGYSATCTSSSVPNNSTSAKFSSIGGKIERPTTGAKTSATALKPTKFTISTKFLRRPRNKLKTAKMPLTSTTTCGPLEMRADSLERQQQVLDDSNAKFKDFSIDSLLNK